MPRCSQLVQLRRLGTQFATNCARTLFTLFILNLQQASKMQFSELYIDEAMESKLGWFDLPIEIRVPIYFLVIRPDCLNGCRKSHEHQRNSTACINLMITCSQVYVETIDILHLAQRQLQISSAGMQVFRHSKDFPRPDLFKCDTRSARCYLPPRMSELEFVRIRNLDLIVDFRPRNGTQTDDSKHLYRLEKNVSTVAKAVSKMTNSVAVSLQLVFPFRAHHDKKQVEGVRKALLPLLKAFATKKLRLTILLEHDAQEFWVNTGLQLYVNELSGFDDTNFNVITATAEVDDQGDVSAEWSIEPVQKDISNIITEDLKGWNPTTEAYRLIPECRDCLAIFSSFEELGRHLTRFCSHKVQFRSRQLNELSARPHNSASRKCWTCGRGFGALSTLNHHLDMAHHRRHGIVPRYVEHNDEYDRYWSDWLQKTGWL